MTIPVKIEDVGRLRRFNIADHVRDETIAEIFYSSNYMHEYFSNRFQFKSTFNLALQLSFLGNWCFKPETPITPCDRQLLGRGPMQDVTTQKHDYTWKRVIPPTELRPENNLTFSPSPLECKCLAIRKIISP